MTCISCGGELDTGGRCLKCGISTVGPLRGQCVLTPGMDRTVKQRLDDIEKRLERIETMLLQLPWTQNHES